MPHIKFNYLYRDAGNYKQFGSFILPNPDNLSLTEFEVNIRAKLIDETWFYAHEWQVPDLRPSYIDDDDPTWHEFESIEY